MQINRADIIFKNYVIKKKTSEQVSRDRLDMREKKRINYNQINEFNYDQAFTNNLAVINNSKRMNITTFKQSKDPLYAKINLIKHTNEIPKGDVIIDKKIENRKKLLYYNNLFVLNEDESNTNKIFEKINQIDLKNQTFTKNRRKSYNINFSANTQKPQIKLLKFNKEDILSRKQVDDKWDYLFLQ